MLVMIAAVALGLSMVSAAQPAPEHVDAIGTASNQSTILVTTIVGFLSLLATQGFAMWRDNRAQKAAERARQQEREDAARQRAWDLEDRQTARAEMRQSMQAQQIETISVASELAKQAVGHRKQLTEQIEENTRLTHKGVEKAEAAYEVGNNFNQRLEELRRELVGKRGQIDHIEEVSEDTNTKVTEIKEGSKP